MATIASRACDTAWEETNGGTWKTRALSGLSWAWFKPTQAQYVAGANWYRCDLVTNTSRLEPLPTKPHRLLGTGGAIPDRWRQCHRGDVTEDEGQRVACSRRHNWRLFRIVRLGADSEKKLPGVDELGKRGQERCLGATADAYGPVEAYFIVPGRDQWKDGYRHIPCWAAVKH